MITANATTTITRIAVSTIIVVDMRSLLLLVSRQFDDFDFLFGWRIIFAS